MRLRGEKKKPRVEMLPLMDIVFLLLVFFVYSMMIMAVHRGMPLNLPLSAVGEREPAQARSLSVRADGSLFLDKAPVLLENLSEELKQGTVGADGAEAVSLLLFAEDTVSYQDLYRVLDAVKSAGIQKISLQARKSPGEL
ncbi:MAG: biopolymer transporter ExbD [Desulfovibrio sp.]|jgi:biopolymer transport protein ExbD|nr:biopolymer transporter ExbD [Desulfovibrio sp.]